MPRILVNIQSSEWSVHFMAADCKTRIGPWLLFDTHDEVREILRWGNITPEELAEHESSIRRWGTSSAWVELTDSQFAALLKRGIGWPWNGYELVQMKKAGRYPPARLIGKPPKK